MFKRRSPFRAAVEWTLGSSAATALIVALVLIALKYLR